MIEGWALLDSSEDRFAKLDGHALHSQGDVGFFWNHGDKMGSWDSAEQSKLGYGGEFS